MMKKVNKIVSMQEEARKTKKEEENAKLDYLQQHYSKDHPYYKKYEEIMETQVTKDVKRQRST